MLRDRDFSLTEPTMVVHSRAQLSAAIGAIQVGSYELIEWNHKQGRTLYFFDHRRKLDREGRRIDRHIAAVQKRIKKLPRHIK